MKNNGEKKVIEKIKSRKRKGKLSIHELLFVVIL